MKLKTKLRQKHPVALSFVAGAIEYRGNFSLRQDRSLEIRLRSGGDLPKTLFAVFGGSCYTHRQNRVVIGGRVTSKRTPPQRTVYQVRGRKAVSLLRLLLPYLTCRKREAFRMLRACEKQRAA